MKRDKRMTFRFDAAAAQPNSRKAAGDDLMEQPVRSMPEMAAEQAAPEAMMPKPEPPVDKARLQDPLFQDDIHALEMLIRSENGVESQRARHASKARDNLREESAETHSPAAPSVWSFPEPIKQPKPKLKVVETERKLNSGPNRIDVEDRTDQPLEQPSADYGPSTADITKSAIAMPIQPASSPLQAKPHESQIIGTIDLSTTDYHYKKSYSGGPSWLKVFASVTGAIATGALFGYLALALFAGQGPWSNDSDPQTTAAVVDDATTDPSASADAGQSTVSPDATGQQPGSSNSGTGQTGSPSKAPAATDQATASAVQVDIAARTYYALQYGVFSSAEGADAAVAELKDKGLAAHRWDTGSDYRVYIGISGDRDGALALSQQLQGLEVYVKEIELPAIATMPFEGDSKLLQTYWKQTNELIGVLDRLTQEQLGLASPKPFDSAVSSAWKRLHEQWLASSSAIAGKFRDENAKEASNRLAQSMNTAAVTLAEFDKKPSEAYLWNAQSALMGAVFAEKGWLDASR